MYHGISPARELRDSAPKLCADCQVLFVFFLLACAAICAGQATAGKAVAVNTQKQLLQALRDPGVINITVETSLRLRCHGCRILIDRNLTISGPALQPTATSAAAAASPAAAASASPAASPAAAVAIYFSYERILYIGPGVLLVLQNIALHETYTAWGPGLMMIHHAPQSRVRLHNAMFSQPLCSPDLPSLRDGLQSSPLPPGYSPPRELYDAATKGPFANRLFVWDLTLCQQQWLYAQDCRDNAGYMETMVHEVAFSYGNSSVVYEYWNVYIPCYSYADPQCVQHHGYHACYDEGIKRVIWWHRLQENKWQYTAGVVVAAVVVWLSLVWWQQQQQQQQHNSVGLAFTPPQHNSSNSTPPSLPLSEGSTVKPLQGDLAGLSVGILIGAGSYGRCYKGKWRGQVVAVKVMDVLGSKDLWAARQELDINMMLQHDNVVRSLHYYMQAQAPSDTEGSGSANLTMAASNVEESSSSWPLTSSSDCLLVGSTSSPSSGPGGQQHPPFIQVLLVMELCDGGSLYHAALSGLFRRHLSGSDTPFNNMASVLQVALDVARGMQHLHQHSVCHGDLCSNNVLLCKSEQVPPPLGAVAKVADMGLSRLIPQQGTHLSTLTHGTVTHMAPEVLLTGRRRLASDVYSYGILLWEVVHLGTPLPSSSSTSSPSPDACAAATGDAGCSSVAAQEAARVVAREQRGPSSSKTITSVYPELPSTPWLIMLQVSEGLRPQFVAGRAVPGWYIDLAERCWDAAQEKRPTFTEIVELLEGMLNGAATAAVDSSGCVGWF